MKTSSYPICASCGIPLAIKGIPYLNALHIKVTFETERRETGMSDILSVAPCPGNLKFTISDNP